jgi:hypothetical protein
VWGKRPLSRAASSRGVLTWADSSVTTSSRAWVYTQAELCDQIRVLAATPTARTESAAPLASDASLRQHLAFARQRIRELTDDNQELRDQIAALHGQLRAERLALLIHAGLAGAARLT